MFLKIVRKMRSLQWRLVFIFVLMSFALMISASVSLNYFMQSMYYDAFKKRIEKGFEEWSIKDNLSREEIVKYLRDDKNSIFLFWTNEYKTYTIVDKNTNEIIYSSEKLFESDNEKLFNEILQSRNYIEALANKIGFDRNLLYYGDRVYFDYARQKGDYILYFRYNREEWISTLNQFNKIIQISFLIAVLASLVIGYAMSKTITGPIVNIMHRFRKIAAGDFGEVLEVKSDDEIGKLTKAFNFMSKELKNTLVKISSEKNKIEIILNYLTDGVVAFNIKGKVIHANPEVKKILRMGDEEFSFEQFSQKLNLDFKLEEVFKPDFKNIGEQNVRINEMFLKVHFAVFTDETNNIEGLIAVIRDITKQQNLENMRKEFVANVSHELRTPLTSIKSYSETLLNGSLQDKEASERFLNVINSEVDRMTRLVKDLLQLSSIDSGKLCMNFEELSIVDLVARSIEKIKLEAQNKMQHIKVSFEKNLPYVNIDNDRIQQVILNILSNSIKYTPEGGKIEVSISKAGGKIHIKVRDNGIGIPKEDISRIFDRFYRVDKARSREMGGTGLGLSIAKEIIEAHKGKISIKSQPGKFTEVLIVLPICNSFLNAV